MRVVFFGTPDFAASILEALIVSKIDIVAVISRPDRPQGRGKQMGEPAVKKMAQQKLPHIPVLQPEKSSTDEFIEILKTFQADLFIVVAYGEILRQKVLDIPKISCINVHASLLPKLRGAAPIQRAIMEGYKETGVTIMKMVLKMDAGDILRQEVVSIGDEMTSGELFDALVEPAAHALLRTIDDFSRGTVQFVPQNEEQVTFAHKIENEEGFFSWDEDVAVLDRRIRGVTPYPGAFCQVMIRGVKKRLKIGRVRKSEAVGKPGEILSWGKGGLVVACRNGSLLIDTVQLEGKKLMSGEEFCRGFLLTEVLFFI